MSVRVRYAPSPTGSPHVGNIRTALYNHLFAKRHGGTNILRIEDTDRARAVPGCEQEIMESLRYVGVEWQEGPVFQSERKESGVYEPLWRELIDRGQAYLAFETTDELAAIRADQEAKKLPTGYFGGEWRDASPSQVERALAEGRPGVVRLKVPRDQTITFRDEIRGQVSVDSNTVDDPVLIKADGMPTYHFAAMVDDHLMDVTHIFRGEEWLGSAPKHIVLFQAFGWEPPALVHLPVIKGKDGSKLSKRHGDTACLDFRRAGYQGHALANFIALIGWSPGGDREVMTMDEMAEAFDLRGIQPSSGVFDHEKLNWISGMHIRRSSPETLLGELEDYVRGEDVSEYWASHPDSNVDIEGLQMFSPPTASSSSGRPGASGHGQDGSDRIEAIKLLQERVTTLADFGEACKFLFVDRVALDPKAAAKWLDEPSTPHVFAWLIGRLDGSGQFDTPESWETLLRECQAELGLEKLGAVVHPVRVALTGKTTGPGLFELMAALGQGRVLDRLRMVG